MKTVSVCLFVPKLLLVLHNGVCRVVVLESSNIYVEFSDPGCMKLSYKLEQFPRD